MRRAESDFPFLEKRAVRGKKDRIMKQLILVEGLPGTGKTTTAQSIFERLAAKGEKATVLFEGDERIPCDFYEMAGIPIDEFAPFRARHSDIPDELWGISLQTSNYVYLRLDKCSDFVADAFRKWDMGDECNKQVGVAQYISCASERLDHWASSSMDNQDVVIIDSGFLQNPINELLFRNAADDEIRSFITGIAETLKPLHPFCLYLCRESAQAAVFFAKQPRDPIGPPA